MNENAYLREALLRVTQELGVPDDTYAAPVANAYNIAADALNGTPTRNLGYSSHNLTRQQNDLVQRILDGIPDLTQYDHEPLCAMSHANNPHCNCSVARTASAREALALLLRDLTGPDKPRSEK